MENQVRYVDLGLVSKEIYTGIWEYQHVIDIQEPTILQWSMEKESVSFSGIHPTDLTHIFEHLEDKIRIWDASYELWKNHGNPLDDERFPKPLDHPTDDHPWNIDWKAYALKNGMNFKAEESEDEYGEEEEA
mgnify:CR=1 FL=1